MSNNVLATVVPAVLGAILALFVMVGLVMSQTAAPDSNPAAEPALVYGA